MIQCMTQRIVPVRDRRQRRRILTLKNFGRIAIAVAVLFAGLTIRSEMRRTTTGDYGRLFGKQVAGQTEIVKPKYDVIKEASPVSDQTAADPTLLEPAARSQYLGVESTMAPASPPAADEIRPAMPAQPAGNGAAIVGDASGVTIVRGTSERRPVLTGGIFRQQQ